MYEYINKWLEGYSLINKIKTKGLYQLWKQVGIFDLISLKETGHCLITTINSIFKNENFIRLDIRLK